MSNTEQELSGIASEYEFLSKELVRDILYADLYALRGKTKEQKLVIRDRWLKDYLMCEYRIPSVDRTDVVFFRSLSRSDYKELFHSIIKTVGTDNYIVVEDYKRRKENTNPEASRHLIDAWPLRTLIDVDDPLERMCCFIRLCMYTFILDKLREIKFDVLVCFADMQPVEHLAATYFNSIGVATVTLQHGLYVDYGDMDTVNIINYMHQPSRYFLAWGEHTASLINRYHPDTEIVVCGKPVVSTGGHSTLDDSAGSQHVMVILDQKIFDEFNERMLRLVVSFSTKLNLSVRVRFHPSLNKTAYLRKYPQIIDALYFLDAAFVIGHTSSLIYEAIALGCKVFRYQTSVPAIPLPASCSFRDENELADLVLSKYPTQLAKNYITAINDESQAMYGRFFQKVLASHVFGD